MVLSQYNYLMALGTIFATLDAWNIGANDVASAWATAVAARSVTYLQAMILALFMEFIGSVAVGSRVAETIRTQIVDVAHYEESPEVLMLGMVCAVAGSSIWITTATWIGLPVSSTHSILGGVLGMGVATVGWKRVKWVGEGEGSGAKIKSGVLQVFVAWILAPVLSGVFGAIIFTVTKYGVLVWQNAVLRSLVLIPIYFGITAMLLAMLLIWKGGSYKVEVPDAVIPGLIVGVGVAFGIICGLTLCPFLYRKIYLNDWQLKWYHICLGPLLLTRGPVPEPSAEYLDKQAKRYATTLNEVGISPTPDRMRSSTEIEVMADATLPDTLTNQAKTPSIAESQVAPTNAPTNWVSVAPLPHRSIIGSKPSGLPRYSQPMLWWYFKFMVFHGVDKDVVSSQCDDGSGRLGKVSEVHERSSRYNERAEYVFSFLQVMTSAAASFAHGANDVGNAIGPFTTVYEIWHTGTLTTKQTPIWILVYGGLLINLGLWTYAYKVMRNLGNRLILQSPSRGFSTEMGSVVAVIVATRLALPISTIQCITGATVGVGLCNGDWKAVNWRLVGWTYVGWLVTVPVTATIAGCLAGIVLNGPRW